MPLWRRDCFEHPLRVVRTDPLGRILYGVGICGPSASGQLMVFQSGVVPSGYYEDDTQSIELPRTPIDCGTLLYVSPSGQSATISPSQAYSFEYSFGSMLTQSGQYSWVAQPDGPIVYPPPEVQQSQMRDAGSHAVVDVSGTVFVTTGSAQSSDSSVVYLIDISGSASTSPVVSDSDKASQAVVDLNGTYLISGAASSSDVAVQTGVSISGMQFLYATFADSKDGSFSTFIEVSGNAGFSDAQSGVDRTSQIVNTSGQYSDGSFESVLPQQLGDADKPYNRLAVSGNYLFGSPILDEASSYIFDESGEPLMSEA